MMGQSQSSRKESSIAFPPMKTGTTYVNQEKEEFFPDSSSSNAEPGYLKNYQNEDFMNSISALVNTTLTELRSEMITMINKNRGQYVAFRR